MLGKDARSASFVTLALRLVAEIDWQIDTLSTDGKKQGAGTEQVRGLKGGVRVEDPGKRPDGRDRTFLDTALMTTRDLVVSVDSAPAHLAGALKVPVWVAVGAVLAEIWRKDDTFGWTDAPFCSLMYLKVSARPKPIDFSPSCPRHPGSRRS